MSIEQIIQYLLQGAFSAVFLGLFLREQRAHEETRRSYRADLRELAGLRGEGLFQVPKDGIALPKPPE